MRIGLMSDTHSFLDARVLEHFKDCDEIWHGGDFGSMQLIDALRASGKPVRGVFGNIDNREIQAEFPLNLSWETAGLRVFMTHIGGYPGRYEPRVREILLSEKPGLFISGHSHILKIIPDKKLNLLHINPGACGNEGWHKVKTLVRFSIENGRMFDMEVIELGARGR